MSDVNPLQYVFLLLCGGAILGSLFDVYNTATGVSKWLRWLRPLLDVAFWLIAAGIVFRISLATDSGIFRIYTFILLAIGFGLYAMTLRKMVIASALHVVHFVGEIIRWIWCVLYRLFIWPLIVLGKTCISLLKLFYRLGLSVEQLAVRLFRVLLAIAVFPLRPTVQMVQPWRKEIYLVSEGIWEWLSKCILYRFDRNA